MSGTRSKKLMSSSRIPSPSRTPASYTRRGSQASTPQRSRSSSMSPTRGGGISPACSSRSLENLSPIRPVDVHKSRSTEIKLGGGGTGKNLVRYITLEMIRKLAREDQIEHIKQLTFNFSGEKKIRYIENLEGLKNLVLLNLNGNLIQRIEKLDRLTNLRQLNLADNKIEKIEGLENLVNLQLLSLEGNFIERIPLWLAKKLRCLQAVKLARNNISSLTDIVRLRGLHDLHSLTIADNPLCELPHHRPYVIFHLRVLNQLDDIKVASSERSDASKRFSQEELDRLNRELQNTENQLKQTQELHNKSMEELELMASRERDMEEREHRGVESRGQLERELDAKDELLKRKAKELQRAQAKHYQLEQELAFMKLDTKFQPLDLPPGDGLDDEDSPYLGKSRFKRNEFAVEGNIPNKKQQYKIMEEQSRRQLDEQLAEKQNQLNEAAERLAALQRELRETQNQVFNASRELNKLEQTAAARKLSEAEKQKIRQKLAAKIRKINQMREDAEKLESDLSHFRNRIPGMRTDLDDLRARLAVLDPNSPEYGHVHAEMTSKEAEIRELTNQIEENDATLERLLKSIAVDTDAIKQLEDQLEKGTNPSDDSLRHELEDIVRGLQDYLVNVRRKADAQRAEFDNLLRDKERLVRKLAAMEQEKSLMMSDADDYTQLQQQLDALNKSMVDMQDLNSSLQEEAAHLTKHDVELQAQLQEAQKRVESLHRSMQESDRKNQSDREKLNKQMEEMAKLQNKIGDRESEAAALKKEIGKLKNHNNELNARAKQYEKEFTHMLQPHEVAQRLAQLGETLKNGDREALQSSRDGGSLEYALKDLGDVLFDLLEKENQDKEKAEKALQTLENHVGNLKKKLVEAQREYKETMEAATDAKIEAEKRKHENALRCLDNEIMQLRDRLQNAEDDAELLRAFAENEKTKKDEELREKDERARLYDAQSQATIRDLERELGVTRRGIRDKEEKINKELRENRGKVQALHKKLQRLEEERENNLMDTMDAEATARKALDDLANAEEEIQALEDLLKAHESEPSGKRGRGTMRRLHDSLAARQGEVDRLRKVLRGRKLTPEQIDNLLDDLAALRDALSSNHQYIRTLWPGYYYFVPGGGKWAHNGRRHVGPPPVPPPGVSLQGVTVDHSQGALQPGTPGMITSQEDGSLVFVPFDGSYCNVAEHHELEDEVTALQEALERCKEKRKAYKLELSESMKLVGPLEEGERRLEELREVIKSHEEMLKKLKEDEEMMAKEKTETAKELADLKDTLTNKLQRKHQLEEKVGLLLGELRTEEALMQRDELIDELQSLERTLTKRRADLRDADRLLREAREGAEQQEEKAEAMVMRYEKARNELNEAEQDAEEIERQASDTGTKLVRARNELRQLQEQIKETEARKIQLDDQCRQLARLVTNKEAEFTALEQKTDHMTSSLERLQSELIVTEEKEAERLAALRESEKVLSERREEISKLKDQGMVQRDEVEGLDRMLGKKKTELQLLQENMEQHQSELSNVLKEGKADVQEKQKQIKQLRHDVDDLTSTKNDLEAQISRRRSELVGVRENSEKASEELQSKISEVNRQKSELKHVLEMLGLEQQELESLKRQHDSKSSELADTQHRLLEERTEFDRMLSDVQRKESELSKVKQNVEKLRSDVDCLTSQRSTLEETVTSLMKEKDMLANTAAALEDKIQMGKKTLYEIRTNIDKSSSTLDEVDQELSQSKKDLHEANLMKSSINKEISSLTATSKDLKSELMSYRSELQDVQDQLHVLDQDLRTASKERDDISMEVVSLREELKSRGHDVELINQQLKRKREETQRAEENAREKREELSVKERDIERLSRDIERHEEKLSRTVAELNSDIQRLQRELAEQRDELESTVIKRDAIKRDMERLGRLDGKFEETESQIRILESRLVEKERELHSSQRDRADLKGALATVESEMRALQVEAEHESRKLQGKMEDLKHELERTKSRAEEEIASLEKMGQEHRDRASRLSNEVNQLRADQIRLKKEIRFLEEEQEKERAVLQASARRLRDEIDEKVEKSMNLLDSSHSEAVEDMKDLLQQRESNQKKISALKEIQRSRSPHRSYPTRKEDRTVFSLQEDLKAKQEEITSQIRTQMNRHREQWQARKLQSEGKLRSLRKKVDNLDELVSNTSIDSLSHSRDRESSPVRVLPTLEERENHSPPERDFLRFS